MKNNPLATMDYSKTIFSPRWFMENMLYIVTKKGKLKKFKLNEEQDKLLAHVEFCIANELPIRMIVLKARQIGSTTFFVGLGFWVACMNRNKTYGIVAHRLDSANSIFQKNQIFYHNLPVEIRPTTTQLSGEGITFNKKNGKGINSRIQFATVNEGVFRGQTLTYLHLTECAFWEGNVQAIENSLAPTVAIAPFTFVVRESTANGYNFFKDDWDRAIRGDSEYTPFFFGWQDHKEYRLKVARDFKMTEKEEQIKNRFNLDLEQVAWRRYQVENNYGGNETWFSQENPMTPEEAFVASGTSVFDSTTISEGYAASVEPIEKKVLTSYPTFEKLYIWERPQVVEKEIYSQKVVWNDELQDYEYVDTDLLLEVQNFLTPYTIGIDTSGMGADFNQITVVNNVTKEVVARYGKKNLSEEALASIAVEIAKMYNNALIAPEVNYSHEICNFIIKLGYKNIYITENLAKQGNKIVGGIEYGWKTTTLTKPSIISHLRSQLNTNPSLIKDREFWYEAEYYIMEDISKNISNATAGHHDDIIMATAIAMYVSGSMQSKQQLITIKGGNKTKTLFEKQKKGNKIRKGIYKNYA